MGWPGGAHRTAASSARIRAIVKTWPVNFRTPRSLSMGFKPDADVETLIRDYIADENIKIA